MKTKELNNKTDRKQFSIKLGDTNSVEVSTGTIKLAKRWSLFGSHDPVGTGTLSIQYEIENTPALILDDNLDLFVLCCNGRTGKNIALETNNSLEIPFTVNIQSEAIKGYSDNQIRNFKVKYTVSVKLDSDTTRKKIYDVIIINVY
jgi:hypothetical protein